MAPLLCSLDHVVNMSAQDNLPFSVHCCLKYVQLSLCDWVEGLFYGCTYGATSCSRAYALCPSIHGWGVLFLWGGGLPCLPSLGPGWFRGVYFLRFYRARTRWSFPCLCSFSVPGFYGLTGVSLSLNFLLVSALVFRVFCVFVFLCFCVLFWYLTSSFFVREKSF